MRKIQCFIIVFKQITQIIIFFIIDYITYFKICISYPDI